MFIFHHSSRAAEFFFLGFMHPNPSHLDLSYPASLHSSLSYPSGSTRRRCPSELRSKVKNTAFCSIQDKVESKTRQKEVKKSKETEIVKIWPEINSKNFINDCKSVFSSIFRAFFSFCLRRNWKDGQTN